VRQKKTKIEKSQSDKSEDKMHHGREQKVVRVDPAEKAFKK
jgi:hypothetical protein